MSMSTPTSIDCTVTCLCYTRPTRTASIDAFIEVLQRCKASGLIDTVVHRTWPSEIPLSGSGSASESRAVFERFRAWATREDINICPPFERVTQRSTITGEQRQVLHTPMLCLAFYVNTELAAVYPCTADGKTETVSDVIETLQTGSLPKRILRAARDRPQLGRCPECGDTCPSGQGVYACRSCRWVAGTTSMGHYRRLPVIRTQWVADSRFDSDPNARSQIR